ncbi:DUF115 domain-containing protein [Gammaproteobacteria bacterium]|nr:DUF115 domain-containing protein [Gammaproteobacteria bacterium]
MKIRYRHYAGFCFRWLRANGIAITANDHRVASLKDKYKGRRCFIIGNGPSLRITDLDKLKNEITFASNKIYLAFDQTQWRPTYYSVIDVLVAENNRSEINELNLFKVFGETVRPYFRKAKDILWLKMLRAPGFNRNYAGRFSTNALKGVYGGASVVYSQIQFAFYLGIKEVYLIGVDYSFEVPKPTGQQCESGEILEHRGENNHFHPEYRKLGERWTTPLLDLQYKAYLAANATFTEHGGKIYNASRKTALDVFTQVNFDHIIAKID